MKHSLYLSLIALVLTGCGASSSEAPTPVPTVRLTAVNQIDVPLQAYLSTEQDEALIQRAAFRQQVVCAARFGVVMEPTEVDAASIQAGIKLERRYGLINSDEVAQYGYDLPPAPGVGSKDDVKGDAQPSLADEVISGQVQTGDGGPSKMTDSDGNPMPEGGCGKEGWDVVRGDVAYDYDDLPKQLLEQARLQMLADPEYQAAEKDWSECMKRAGYDFPHPSDAGNSVIDESKETQHTMAGLEVACAQEVNFPGRAMAVDVAYQNQLIDENEAALRGGIEKKRELMDNAKKALA